MILYSSAGVGVVVIVVVFDYAASSMTTENGKREGRNWPEMTSSGGSLTVTDKYNNGIQQNRWCDSDWSFIFKKISHDGKPVSLSTYTSTSTHVHLRRESS
ncbi:hypothetical protein Tsp_09938 [Trichinella spiralis]|uniref:hypothetical protein n=1 Tax=Trichinella spiralis TaxID=6334 RepID=UPI0001EFE00C|nr:hypothetical protein Tsp_09938 [Trichinella spiralis]